MKVVLDIQDSKADFILEWLKQYAFVKIKAEKKRSKVKSESSDDAKNKQSRPSPKKGTEPNAMQQLLLKGPVMTDNQYKNFQKKRTHLSAWK